MNPTININGTGSIELARTLSEASIAVRKALDAIRIAAPHPRDYLTTKEWEHAAKQHAKWARTVRDISIEIENTEIHVQDQILEG